MSENPELSFHQYRKNLNSHLFSIERIDCNRVIKILKAIYELIGLKEPQIVFCESPKLGYQISRSIQAKTRLHKELYLRTDYNLLSQKQFDSFQDLVMNHLRLSMIADKDYQIDLLIGQNLEIIEWGLFDNKMDFYEEMTGFTYAVLSPPIVTPSYLINAVCRVFIYRQSGVSIDTNTALLVNWLFRLLQNVGWMFPYQDVCIVCDRPTRILVDGKAVSDIPLKGKLDIYFRDGYNISSDLGARSNLNEL